MSNYRDMSDKDKLAWLQKRAMADAEQVIKKQLYLPEKPQTSSFETAKRVKSLKTLPDPLATDLPIKSAIPKKVLSNAEIPAPKAQKPLVGRASRANTLDSKSSKSYDSLSPSPDYIASRTSKASTSDPKSSKSYDSLSLSPDYNANSTVDSDIDSPMEMKPLKLNYRYRNRSKEIAPSSPVTTPKTPDPVPSPSQHYESIIAELGEKRAIKRDRFFRIAKKNDGVNAGVVARKNNKINNPHVWMVKAVSPENTFKEYIGGNLMRFMLNGDQAPKIRLNIDAHGVYICSRFLSNFETLYSVRQKDPNYNINQTAEALVASMVISDPDAHTGNIGKVTTKDGKQLVGRIDFDQSLAFGGTIDGKNYFDFLLNAMDVTEHHPYNGVLTSNEFASALQKLGDIDQKHLKSIISKSVSNLFQAYKKPGTPLNVEMLRPLAYSLYGKDADKYAGNVILPEHLAKGIFENVSTRLKDLQVLGKMITTTKDLQAGKISILESCEAFRGYQKECSEAHFQPLLRIAYKNSGKDLKFTSMINILDLERKLDNKSGFYSFLANINPRYEYPKPQRTFNHQTNQYYYKQPDWWEYRKTAGEAPGFIRSDSICRDDCNNFIQLVNQANTTNILFDQTDIKNIFNDFTSNIIKSNNAQTYSNNIKLALISATQKVTQVIADQISTKIGHPDVANFLRSIDIELAKKIVASAAKNITEHGMNQRDPNFISNELKKLSNNIAQFQPSETKIVAIVKESMINQINQNFAKITPNKREQFIKHLVESVPTQLLPTSLIQTETAYSDSNLLLANHIYMNAKASKPLSNSYSSYLNNQIPVTQVPVPQTSKQIKNTEVRATKNIVLSSPKIAVNPRIRVQSTSQNYNLQTTNINSPKNSTARKPSPIRRLISFFQTIINNTPNKAQQETAPLVPKIDPIAAELKARAAFNAATKATGITQETIDQAKKIVKTAQLAIPVKPKRPVSPPKPTARNNQRIK